MRLTRWKLMAGVLGLSMCGLAALAEPACRTVGLTRRADEPKQEPAEASKPLPLPVPAPPSATEVPPPIILPVDDKKPAPLPSPVPAPELKPPDLKPIALPPINDPTLSPAVDPRLLADVHKIQNPPVPLPTLTEKVSEPLIPLPSPIHSPTPAPIPVPAPKPLAVDPLPATPQPFIAPGHAPTPVVPVADTKLVPVFSEVKKPDVPPIPGVEKKTDVPPVVAERVAPAAGVVAKKLKVMLHLSDEKPWFEVKDGDEVVLKVTADAVSLEAAVSGKTTSTLTATGGVTFRTLGGFGTCDELKVVPGTGEVVVTGKVAVTSNWGKAETTATADKMTFRLGGDAGKK